MKNLRPLFAVSLFVSSGLLFLIEPIVAKLLLPPFGGSPLVWNVCLLFFQVALLGGYLYAHGFAKRGLPRPAHAWALLGGLALFAATFLPWSEPGAWFRTGLPPTLGLTLLLVVRIGVPFFLLSASAPLLQSWYSASRSNDGEDPYFLYAASNLGSLCGLLSYPFLIEPHLTLAYQRGLCSGAFAVVVALFFVCARSVSVFGPGVVDDPQETAPIATPPWSRLRWALLAAGPSAMLMGLTGYLTINIAPVPLLWVLPLTLYLLTFVIAFARRKALGGRALRALVPVLCFPAAVTICLPTNGPIQIVIPLHLLSFFAIALACHSQLNDLRPHKSELTSYYLWISIGGGIGGVFAAVLAPMLFHSLVEYPIAIVASCVALGTLDWKGDKAPWDFVVALLAGTVVYWLKRNYTAGPYEYVWVYAFGGFLMVSALRPVRYGLVLGASLVVCNFVYGLSLPDVLMQDRNFFGVHNVSSILDGRLHRLTNGTTTHGEQWTTSPLDREPLTYYTRSSPIGQLFKEFSGVRRKGRVAVVGLGTGTLASYGQTGQTFDFYDIDPMVVQIAENPKLFTYLKLCRAKWNVILGDARLSIAKAAPSSYGIVALDAFASDAIPVHLITVEAFRIYESKLEAHGVIAVHISNRYLDLRTVVAGAAKQAGMVAIVRTDEATDAEYQTEHRFSSVWVLLARDRHDFGSIADDVSWSTVVPGNRPWTDDFSDIVETIKR